MRSNVCIPKIGERVRDARTGMTVVVVGLVGITRGSRAGIHLRVRQVGSRTRADTIDDLLSLEDAERLN